MNEVSLPGGGEATEQSAKRVTIHKKFTGSDRYFCGRKSSGVPANVSLPHRDCDICLTVYMNLVIA